MRSILKCETGDLTSCLEMREDLKGRSLSFTEIAKLVGENWQTLNPKEKEPYEAQAFAAKETYTVKLAEYRQTENYRTYAEYLAAFKAKQQYQLEASQDGKKSGRVKGKAPKLTESASQDGSKRPKLENLPSQSSSSTVNSCSSSTMRSEGTIMEISAGSKGRIQSIGSSAPPSSWITGEAMVQQTALPAISSALGEVAQVRRESIVPAVPSIPWRAQKRPIELPIHGYAAQPDQRPLAIGRYSDTPASYFQRYPSQQSSVGGFTPPPLLTSQSTDSTIKSSISSGSGESRIGNSYFGPRTSQDETSRNVPSLPLPPIYSGSKLSGTFDGHLPPIRRGSLSPTSSINPSYKPGPPSKSHHISAHTKHASFNMTIGSMAIDFQPVAANRFPISRLPPSSHLGHPQLYRHGSSTDENIGPLDPISALIHAGEIVNTQGQQQQNQQLQHKQPHEQQPQQSHNHHQQC